MSGLLRKNLFNSSFVVFSLSVRDRVVSAKVAFLYDHDRQSDRGGRAAPDAGFGGVMPRLADSSDYNHCPICINAAIRLVRLTM